MLLLALEFCWFLLLNIFYLHTFTSVQTIYHKAPLERIKKKIDMLNLINEKEK